MMHLWAVLSFCKGISSATHGWLYGMNLGAMQIMLRCANRSETA
jgi:hypothetical protein